MLHWLVKTGIKFVNFIGFLSGVVEVSVLLGYHTSSYSMVKMLKKKLNGIIFAPQDLL
jgi:hypothetical protein